MGIYRLGNRPLQKYSGLSPHQSCFSGGKKLELRNVRARFGLNKHAFVVQRHRILRRNHTVRVWFHLMLEKNTLLEFKGIEYCKAITVEPRNNAPKSSEKSHNSQFCLSPLTFFFTFSTLLRDFTVFVFSFLCS